MRLGLATCTAVGQRGIFDNLFGYFAVCCGVVDGMVSYDGLAQCRSCFLVVSGFLNQ